MDLNKLSCWILKQLLHLFFTLNHLLILYPTIEFLWVVRWSPLLLIGHRKHQAAVSCDWTDISILTAAHLLENFQQSQLGMKPYTTAGNKLGITTLEYL